MELYKKHRPKEFKDIIGQDIMVRTLRRMIKRKEIPHAILFTGPSGCGKTTLARILKKKLGCGNIDFDEINCADFRGIDMVRSIRQRMQYAPIKSACRIWLIDECHKLSNDAQNALLKMLEDTPEHIYFMLATTLPNKLISTIRTRCTEIAVKSLNDEAMSRLISKVAKVEGLGISDDVTEKIVEYSDGSPRRGLVFLNQLIGTTDEEEQLEAIFSTLSEGPAFEIAKTLFQPRIKWGTMAKVLREVDTNDPEQIRWMVLMYAKAILIKGGRNASRAYQVIDAFHDNFYDSKVAGLVAACWEVIAQE